MNGEKKVEIAMVVSNIAEKVKLGAIVTSIGTYLAKVPKLPVISTGICFGAIAAEYITDYIIINSELDLDDFEDDDTFDGFQEENEDVISSAEETLRNIAEEITAEPEESGETEDFREVEE